MNCRMCAHALPNDATVCPVCQTPRGAGALVMGGGLDRAVDESVAKLVAGSLAWDGTLDALARDLEPDLGTPLSPTELKGALARVEDVLPKIEEIEGMLELDQRPMLEGIVLGELFDKGSDEEKVLKKGLVFLRKRRYDAAVEWFGLHRAQTDATRPKFELLLLLMETYAEVLAGRLERAAKLREQVKAHPTYVELMLRARRG